MAFQVSPGVNVSEIDLTTVVPSVSTTAGGFVGNFRWGPVEQRVLVTDGDRLVENFRTPSNDHANNAADFMVAENFLSYANQLQTIRVVNDSGVKAVNAVMDNDAGAANTSLLVKNDTDYDENFGGGQTRAGTFYTKYPGELGNSLKVSVCAGENAYESKHSVNATCTTATATLTIHSNPNLANNIIVGDKLLLGPDKQIRKVSAVSGNTITLSTNYTGNTFTNSAEVVTRRWEFFNEFDGAPKTSLYANNAGATADELHIAVVDEDGDISGTPGTVLESFSKLSKAKDAKTAQGGNNFYKDIINSQSQWLYWNAHTALAVGASAGNKALNTSFGSPTIPVTASFVSGADGDSATNANFIKGYNLLRDKDVVDVSLIPAGVANQVRVLHLINEIAEVRKDCIICVSPERADVVNNGNFDGAEVEDIVAYRNSLPSTSFAVMDSGYKLQFDRHNDVNRFVPLNGDTAGIMVRTDNVRDPWYSPGGFNRGNVKNVIKLAFNPRKAERDVLYQAGVNPIVAFPGQGTVLFGDKTMLAQPSAFDRINVRRLFIVLEKAIERAAQTTLFEFNDELTRIQFQNIVEPFLRDVQGRRGITDFKVVCDTSNNTAEVIDRNEFIGDIFVKPNRSINFIQLNFVAVRSGVEFNEIVGSV